ncbi:glycoside hydrolase family 2 protein [Microbacterium sp.]|uniref:glycoside hydrolase family 2 protein n=1 Tax=Microbacterium sp. TaxID=51671 RepID=UPI003F717C7D
MTQSHIPRPEHPRPQLRRDDWLSLNGEWQFEIDKSDSGLERGLLVRDLRDEILVPFAPESEASGIGETDFLLAVWYRRTVTVPKGWGDKTVLLHFGAIDHDATVWVNGREVARHRGGFTGFTADLGGVARSGEDITIVVRARDSRDEPQARGKQASRYENSECYYTRTTGIWQTVWLEAVPRTRVGRPRITPQVADSSFDVVVPVINARPGLTVRAEFRDDAGVVATADVRAGSDLAPRLTVSVAAERVRLWHPHDPHLYDVSITLLDENGEVDRVEAYAGLRSVSIDGRRVLLNGEPVFQRLVLDQGWWPHTLMTAPSDEALITDMRLGMEAGFNGARLHQKVFEERYLYHADRLGYLVWGEFGDWGAIDGAASTAFHQQPSASFVTQWLEVLERDHNHPSIIGWCPLNETHQALHDRITQLDDVTHAMYLATKLADPSRPVVDASGYSHRVRGADIYDGHDYEQDPVAFAANHAGLATGDPYVNLRNDEVISIGYGGQPYFVSEYGGIWWNPAIAETADADSQDAERRGSWGYGQRVRSVEEWHARFAGLTDALLDDRLMFGYCYTQLTDTFQEENGLYYADRTPKFDIARIADVQNRPAAYERDAQ